MRRPVLNSYNALAIAARLVTAAMASSASTACRSCSISFYIQAMPAKEATPFSQALDRRVGGGAPWALHEKLPDDEGRCHACAPPRLIQGGVRGVFKDPYKPGGLPIVPPRHLGGP